MLIEICDTVAKVLRHTLVTLGVILIVCVTLLVLGRYVPFVPRWLWPLEIANWAMIWFVFVGASLGLRAGSHFNVDLFMRRAPSGTVQRFLKILHFVVVGFVTLTFIYFGYGFVLRWAMIQTSEVLMINMAYLYVSVPVAGLLWLLFLAEDFYKSFLLKRDHFKRVR